MGVALASEWLGFGLTKNIGNFAAKYDWILSLDADEAIDEQLKKSLHYVHLPVKGSNVYSLSFKTFIGNTQLKYGEYLRDHHIRLFNKKQVQWDTALVHEKLIMPSRVSIKKLDGHVLHYTMKSFESYSRKLFNYASLNSQKLFIAGKKPSWLKIYLSPMAAFLINFIFNMINGIF